MSELRLPLDEIELASRIERNYRRLADGDYYQIENVFAPATYSWQGDKEGRALLAFVSHYKISGQKIPCMEQMLAQMKDRVNELGFFGPVYHEEIHEQQLSGHSWLLRGLCEHYEAFGDAFSLEAVDKITRNLYLNRRGRFASYPVHREKKEEGGVSGSSATVIDGWILSTDIGCAFMSIDGLSHAYCITGNEAIKDLTDEMIRVYLAIDKVALRAQTHCTLTAARGMLRMYGKTKDEAYLDGAKAIWELYVHGGGMTQSYQNLNWWGRPETWTEPCAIVDSLMLSGELYRLTGEEGYRRLAARVWHNGLATSQRDNGGAGTDTVVAEGGQEILRAKMYEAYFCCTMRLAEGLWYAKEQKELLYACLAGKVEKQGRVYADGDLLYAQVNEAGAAYAKGFVSVDGHKLSPLVKYYNIPKEAMEPIEQRIVF